MIGKQLLLTLSLLILINCTLLTADSPAEPQPPV